MSTTIDNRVVEMRFDNKQFEANVQTSMSTLDKLKEKLNLPGASKGLENITNAVKNTSISSLGDAADAVSLRFSALQVAGITCLTNITNSAFNAGKKMIEALTIDPVKTGLQEYETKMNAIQVIKANTRGKNTMSEITKALEELNDYADKTIYNFAQMTSNVGKFTAQGYDVQSAANAVKGLANLAAASGASAEDMARATYQMSQALGGTIKLVDWNSLRNANMSTDELKNTLKDLARVNDIAIDEMIAKHGTFEQTLSEGWLSGSMFTEAMNIYSGIYSDAELKAKGFNDTQIENFKELAEMAESASTEVKTFSQLWDVLKETAQSGWTSTWELIIGEFDVAKSMLTKLQVFFSTIIDGFSDARNALLESALGKNFRGLMDDIQGVIDPVKNTIDTVTESLLDYDKVVDEIIGGKWGNTEERWNALSEAGYDWAHAQNLVNEKLGNGVRRATEYSEVQEDITKSADKAVKSTKKLTKEEGKRLAELSKLSRKELESLGYTEKQINAFRELTKVSDQLGLSVDDFVNNIDEIDGRWLIWHSFANIGQSLISIFKAIGAAWRNAFPPMSGDTLFNIIAAFHKFTASLIPSETTVKNLTRTLQGLFAVIDIITSITKGAFKIGVDIITEILRLTGLLGDNILETTANIGDAIVAFRDWLEEHNLISKAMGKVVPILGKVSQAIYNAGKAIWDLPVVQSVVTKVQTSFESLKETVTKVFGKPLEEVGAFIDEVASMEDISFDKVQKAFKKMCSNIGKHFADLAKELLPEDLYNKLVDVAERLEATYTSVKDALVLAFGEPIALIKEFISTVAQLEEFDLAAIGNAFDTMVSGINKHFAGLLKDLIPEEDYNRILGYIENIKGAFQSLCDLVTRIFGPPTESIKKFIDTVKEMDDLTFSGLVEAFGTMITEIKEHFKGLADEFGPLAEEAVKMFIEGLSGGLSQVYNLATQYASAGYDAVAGILSGIMAAMNEKLKAVLPEEVYNTLVEWGNAIKGVLESIKDVIITIKDAIVDLFKPTPMKALEESGLSGATTIFQKLYDSISKVIGLLTPENFSFDGIAEVFANVGKAIGGMFDSLPDSFDEVKEKVTTFVTSLKEQLSWSNISKGIKGVYWTIPGLKPMLEMFSALADTISQASGDVKNLGSAIKDAFSNLNFGFISSVFWLISAMFSKSRIATIVMGIATILSAVGPAIYNAIKETIGDDSATLQMFEAGFDSIAGFIKGVASGAGELIGTIVDIIGNFVSTVCTLLGIESPSRVFMAIGAFCITGFILGIKENSTKILSIVGDLFTNVLDVVSDIVSKGIPFITDMVGTTGSKIQEALEGTKVDFSKIYIAAALVAIILLVSQFAKAAIMFATPIAKLGDLLGTVSGGFKSLTGVLENGLDKNFKAIALRTFAIALKELAIAIAILGGTLAVLGYIATVNPDAIIMGGVVLAALVTMMVALMKSAQAIKDPSAFIKLGIAMAGLGLGLTLAASAMKKIASIPSDQYLQALIGIAAIMLGMMGVLKAFGKFVSVKKSANMAIVGGMLLQMAFAVGIMAIVMKLLSKMEVGEVVKGTLVIAAFVVMFAALIAVSKFAGKSASRAGSMLLKMAFAIGILVLVIKMIAGIDPGDLLIGLIAISYLMKLFAGVVVASKYAGANASLAGGMLLKMAFAIGVLALVIKVLATISVGDIIKGLAVITYTMLMFVGFTALMGLMDDVKTVGIGGLLFKMAAAIAVLAICIKLMSGLEESEIRKGLATITAIMLMFKGIIRVSEFAGANAALAGTMLWKMSLAILVLVGVIALMSFLTPAEIAQGIIAIGSIMALFAGMIMATSMLNDFKQATAQLGIMLGSIALMGFIIWRLSKLGEKEIKTATIALGSIMGMFAVMIAASSLLKAGDTNIVSMAKIMGTLLVVVVALGILAYALCSLPMNDIAEKKDAIITIVGVMGAMTLLMGVLSVIAKFTKTSDTAEAIVALAGMALALALFGLAVEKIPYINEFKVYSIKAITLLMIAMTALLIPLAIIGKHAGFGVIPAVIALAGLAGALALFGWAVGTLPDISGKEECLNTMVKVMAIMTLLLIPLSLIGGLAGLAIIGMGVLLVMMGEFKLLANLVSGLTDMTGAQTTVDMLTEFMTKMVDLMIKMSPMALLSSIAVVALTGLLGLIGVFGTVATAVGALNALLGNKIDEFLASGIDTLVMMAEGLGKVAGAFIVGFTDQVLVVLPMLGAALSMFMAFALPFIIGIKMVDQSVLDGVSTLAKCIIALCAAEMINGITKFLPFCGSFADLGTELSRFMINALPFVATAKLLTPEMATGVKNLADAILALTAADFINGILEFFGGGVDFAKFGEQLVKFGGAIADFSAAVAGKVDPAAVEAAAKAGEMIANLYDHIEPMDGLVQKLTGTKDLGLFGEQLVAYGQAIVDFSAKVSPEGAVSEKAITAAKKMGELMLELQSQLEPIGGVVNWFTGHDDLGTFGESLKDYGAAVADFSSSVSGDNWVSEAAVTAAKNAGMIMVELQNALPETGWFDSKMDLAQFGAKLQTFGTYLAGFGNAVANMDTTNISMSLSTATRLVDLAAKAAELDSASIEKIADIEIVGGALFNYSSIVASVDASKITTSIGSIRQLMNLINSMSDIDISGVSNFKYAVTSLAQSDLSGLSNSFSGASADLSKVGSTLINSIASGFKGKQSALTNVAKSAITGMASALNKSGEFVKAGASSMDSFVKGIAGKNASLTKAGKSAASSAASGANGGYNNFYSAGSYVVTGFCNGISNNTYRAQLKGLALAKAAYEAAKNFLIVKSPSRLFASLGGYVVAGFCKGVDDNVGYAAESASGMADTAVRGFSNAISRVNDIINSDMDMQPTIRPVLDLSDVTAGAGVLNGLFNASPSVGLMSNLSAINGMMNSMNQNGVNSDVVSALKDLKNTISGGTGNTYVVNGITYDDGSNVSNAIGELIRAAKVERRI